MLLGIVKICARSPTVLATIPLIRQPPRRSNSETQPGFLQRHLLDLSDPFCGYAVLLRQLTQRLFVLAKPAAVKNRFAALIQSGQLGKHAFSLVVLGVSVLQSGRWLHSGIRDVRRWSRWGVIVV